MSESKSNQSQRHYQERAQRALERARKTAPPPEGELVKLPPRSLDSAFKLEQNLGCELPVCVANRRDVDAEFIEVTTDEGVVWKLERTVSSKLPAPEHYPYWLWFLDRCQAAAEKSVDGKLPRIVLEPMEIFDLFGSHCGGKNYGYLDDAFSRFSRMVISAKTAFFEGEREYESRANLGTLCHYQSWRSRPKKDQKAFEFANGWIAPGHLLWSSIQAGYIKSVPLKPLRELGYVAQRLYTFLSKHCEPGGEFAISPDKLLPKIPTVIRRDMLGVKLAPHHDALAKVGFLEGVTFEGRGQSKLIIYQRTIAGCRHLWPEAPSGREPKKQS